MADVSKVGLGLPPYVFVVEKVKIKEFTEAIGEDNPVFLSKGAALAEGYPDIPCPPTFITLSLQEFTGAYLKAFEALGVSLKNVLHGEEEYEYLGEIYAGDRLTCNMNFESVVEKKTKTGSMDLITLRTLFTNQEGKEVLRAKSLIIERK
ncbi:MAG: MaoC family dehydratase N-terminal domain-containing protein [Pseudomonadota bacterium]